MKLQIIGVFLFFTCAGASSLSSLPMDFMAGAKKENILHLKSPQAEIRDFSEAFKDVANSEEKMKTTFRILNRPNDSRFKLDLMLILSQMVIMDNESQSFENKEKAWAVLQPLLEKYDKDFTYPADYDVMSGEFIEIILDDWLDRYTQEKVVRKVEDVTEGSERLEVLESGNIELKSLMDGSGSFEEYLTSLEQESEESTTQEEGSGSSDGVTEEELAALLADEALVEEGRCPEESSTTDCLEQEIKVATRRPAQLPQKNVRTNSSQLSETSLRNLKETIEKMVTLPPQMEKVQRKVEDFQKTVCRINIFLMDLCSNISDFSEKLECKQRENSKITSVFLDSSTKVKLASPKKAVLHFTTEQDDSFEEVETSTEYQLVGTTEDGEAVLQSTTEYYIPEQQEVIDLLAEEGEDSSQVPEQNEGNLEFKHRSGYIVVEKEPLRAGSIRGIPGVHFPDYDEIPITSFSCADKKYIPGFYADLETGCQVFHVCWPNRRESFLCPTGTLFNQGLLSCDYWYSTNCSLSPLYYDVNNRIHESTTTTPCPPTYKSTPKPHTKPTTPHSEPPATPSPSLADVDWARVLSILPIRSKVTVYPQSSKTSTAKDDIFAKTEKGKALKKAIAMKIIGKVLHAAETLAKTAVHTLPIKYATKKPGQVHSTMKPQQIKVHSTVKPHHIKVHSTAKPQQIKVHTTVKPGKIHVKQPPKIIERFVVKSKKFEALKPILAGKLVASPKVHKKQVVQKVKLVKQHIPDVLLGAMEMAGTVLQKDILPLTRMALVESSLKHSKSKRH